MTNRAVPSALDFGDSSATGPFDGLRPLCRRSPMRAAHHHRIGHHLGQGLLNFAHTGGVTGKGYITEVEGTASNLPLPSGNNNVLSILLNNNIITVHNQIASQMIRLMCGLI